MMDRWQLSGYRGRAGAASPFPYGTRDPYSSVRGGGLYPGPTSGIGAGFGLGGGLGGFRDPYARREGGGIFMGQRLPTGGLPYVSGQGLPDLRSVGVGREPDPRLPLALGPVNRLSSGVDPVYYRDLNREDGCDGCRFSPMAGRRNDTALAPYDRSSSGDRYPYRYNGSPFGGYGQNRNLRSEHFCSNSSKSSDFDFATKDIAVRGKTYTVRASYLNEATKFESELQKYVDKKAEEIVPDHVIEMLCSYINHEDYYNDSIIDEVTLNILCSSVSAKSAYKASLDRLNKMKDYDMSEKQMVEVCATILCSDRVDDELKAWLKDYLKKSPERQMWLAQSMEWNQIRSEMPEVESRLFELMGLKEAPAEKDHRIMSIP